ncbi:MAG: DUF2027 domain-containing protein [Bacteroidetes bacterium HGW-Bacteroidetes-4]|jgi:hypothetical protein|nr:MAG: DUF2027 domain-containing protein [Bacteroidetes bacterium HGW-Bacteroidetes-4]
MEIQVGDKVRFLNDVGGGIVSRIIDRRSVMVTNEYGFEVPSPVNDLVVIEHADLYDESPKANNVPAQNHAQETSEVLVDTREIFFPEVSFDKNNGDLINIFYAFVPQGRPGNSDLNVFLINDSNYNMLYTIIGQDASGEIYTLAAGILEANTKEQTETLAFASVNEIPEYHFQLLFYQKKNFNLKEPVSKTITYNPIKFFKERTYQENDFFDTPAILFPVYTDNPIEKELVSLSENELKKIILEKEKTENKAVYQSPKANENQIIEVDLHIHELLDDFRGLSNAEILEVQMEHFKSKLEDAIHTHAKKIVFIHGVGNGVLKMEVRKELDRRSKRLTYQDASFKEYGYGATLVQIK